MPNQGDINHIYSTNGQEQGFCLDIRSSIYPMIYVDSCVFILSLVFMCRSLVPIFTTSVVFMSANTYLSQEAGLLPVYL